MSTTATGGSSYGWRGSEQRVRRRPHPPAPSPCALRAGDEGENGAGFINPGLSPRGDRGNRRGSGGCLPVLGGDIESGTWQRVMLVELNGPRDRHLTVTAISGRGNQLAGDCPIKQAVLLVGGLGTRLRPLTYLRPKALVPVMNRPLISYEIRLLALHGVCDIILAVGYAADTLREHLGDGSRWGVHLTYREDPTPLGTAGAIRNVADLLDDAFFCMNGDLVFDLDLTQIAQRHVEAGATVTHALRQVPDISQYGLIQCDDAGRVTAFREKVTHDETGRNTVNFGLYVMSRGVVERIPTGVAYSSEYDLFPRLLDAGLPLYGFLPEASGYWSDVGRLETYLQTSHDVLGGALPWASAQVPNGASGGFRGPVDAPAGAVVAESAQVGPFVSIGEGVRIGPDAVIRDSVLCDGATIGAGATLQDTIVAWGAVVEPGAHHEAGVVMPPGWRAPD